MSQFFRKLCNMFDNEPAKKTRPPSKLPRQQTPNPTETKARQVTSTSKELLPKASKKSQEVKNILPVEIDQEMVKLRVLRLRKHFKKMDNHEMDWGHLVGFLNKGTKPESLSKKPCYELDISSEGQINSLTALRPYSLDSLVFYCKQIHKYDIQLLLQAKQKLIIIAQSQKSLNLFLTSFETTLLEIQGDSTLKEFGDKICFNIIQEGPQRIIEFLGNSAFEDQFRSFMGKSFSQLKNYEEVNKIMQFMTVQEFQQCQTPHINSVQRRIAEYKDYIKEENLQKIKKNQLLKLIAQFQEQFRSRSPSPLPLNQVAKDEQTDEEVLYFRQLKSEKSEKYFVEETGSTNINSVEISEDLFYFIQEHNEEEEVIQRQHPKVRASVVSEATVLVPLRSSQSLKEFRADFEDYLLMTDCQYIC